MSTALDDLTNFLASAKKSDAPLVVDSCPDLTALSQAHDYDLGFDLALPLLPYQRAGAGYCLRVRRVILGDEMGLGKTPQLIAVAVKAHEEGRRSVISCPPSLREMWVRAIRSFAPHLSTATVEGVKATSIPDADVIIIGDAVLTSWAPLLARERFGALLVDEAHRFKSEKAKRTIALKALARAIPTDGYVILASGTPAVNRPVELVALLDIIGMMQPVFKSAGQFKWRYCDPVKNAFGWTFNGCTNGEELHAKLRGACYVRRRKVDVLTELPAKRRAQLPAVLSPTQLREYTRIEGDFLAWVFDKGGREAVLKASRAETITKLTAMRQALGKAKVDFVLEHLESIIEADEPVVVFAHHRSVIDAIVTACQERAEKDERWKVVRVVGGMTDEAKQSAVDDFQSGKASVFVGNYQSAGVGLTLTRANQWVSVELPYEPASLTQAEDRVHRIGQAEAVTCWHVTGARANGELTLDDRMFDLLNRKQANLSLVLDGHSEDLGAEEASFVSALLSEWVG